MSCNQIDTNADNARAREEQTPMTKIPSLEEINGHRIIEQDETIKVYKGEVVLPISELVKYLTAEREAGRQEALLFHKNRAIEKLYDNADELYDNADEIYNGIIPPQVEDFLQALTPPTK